MRSNWEGVVLNGNRGCRELLEYSRVVSRLVFMSRGDRVHILYMGGSFTWRVRL
jgi:hypothetical protein